MTDLVGLLYRADWTRLSLAAEVSVRRDLDLDRARTEAAVAPPGHEWEMATDQLGTETHRSTLLIQPGRRYREQGDGLRQRVRRGPELARDPGRRRLERRGRRRTRVAAAAHAAAVVAAHRLHPGGRRAVTADGREALRVVATPRPGIWSRRPADSPARPGGDARRPRARHLAAARGDPGRQDAERNRADRGPARPCPGRRRSVRAAGRLGLRPGDRCRGPRRADPAGRRPSSWRAWPRAASARWSSRRGPGRSSRPRRRNPTRRCRRIRTPCRPTRSAVTDQMLHLLHDSRDRWATGITATLHQWHDMAAMLAQIPDGVRRLGFGGLGHSSTRRASGSPPSTKASRLSFDGSGRYRIEPALPGRRAFLPGLRGDDRRRRGAAVVARRGRVARPPGRAAAA